MQRRVATVSLHMAKQYPNKSIQVSHVAVLRKRAPLEECIRVSQHEIVAGCGKKQLRVWLPTLCIPWQAKDALIITLPPGLPAPDLPLNNSHQEDAETQYEDDAPQNDAWQAAFDKGDEVASAPGSDGRPQGQDFPPQGRLGLCQRWDIQHVDEPKNCVATVLGTLRNWAWRSSRELRSAKPHGQVKSGSFARDPGHFAPCPFPHGAFGCVDSGEGLGGGGREEGKNEPFPSGGATLPLGAACRRFKLQCRFCSSSAWIGFCAQRLARIVGPRCLIQKSSKNHLGLRRHVLDTKFGSRHDVTKPLVFR